MIESIEMAQRWSEMLSSWSFVESNDSIFSRSRTSRNESHRSHRVEAELEKNLSSFHFSPHWAFLCFNLHKIATRWLCSESFEGGGELKEIEKINKNFLLFPRAFIDFLQSPFCTSSHADSRTPCGVACVVEHGKKSVDSSRVKWKKKIHRKKEERKKSLPTGQDVWQCWWPADPWAIWCKIRQKSWNLLS